MRKDNSKMSGSIYYVDTNPKGTMSIEEAYAQLKEFVEDARSYGKILSPEEYDTILSNLTGTTKEMREELRKTELLKDIVEKL